MKRNYYINMMYSIKMQIGLNYISSWPNIVIDYLDCNRIESYKVKAFKSSL